MRWWISPLGCACMQHPVQLVPNPQRVLHCRQPGREDTRTGREPLEKHRISWVWSSMPARRCWLIPQRASNTAETLQNVWNAYEPWTNQSWNVWISCWLQENADNSVGRNVSSHLSTVRFPQSPSHSFTDLFKTIEWTQSDALLLNTL